MGNWTKVLQDSMSQPRSRHNMTNHDKLKLINQPYVKYAIPRFSKCKILVGKILTIQHAFVRLFHHQSFTLYGNIYQEKIVIVSTDVQSLQLCNLDMNRQRTIDTFAGKRFSRPCGLALGPNDEIVISDRSLHQLIVFGSDLQFHQVIGHKGSGNGEFSWPHGLYIDEAGFIYVADRKNNRV